MSVLHLVPAFTRPEHGVFTTDPVPLNSFAVLTGFISGLLLSNLLNLSLIICCWIYWISSPLTVIEFIGNLLGWLLLNLSNLFPVDCYWIYCISFWLTIIEFIGFLPGWLLFNISDFFPIDCYWIYWIFSWFLLHLLDLLVIKIRYENWLL
jgi:hypothetical protein